MQTPKLTILAQHKVDGFWNIVSKYISHILITLFDDNELITILKMF